MTMKKWMVIAVCITALPISSAFAAWQEIGSNEQSTVSLDIETLKRDGDKAQIMSMLDFKIAGADPKTKEPIRSIIGLNEYLCGKIQYRPIEYKVFSGNKGEGKVVADVKSPDSPFETITSGSWAAGVYSIACRAQ
jgi:hypothetical protein